jgi:hypothetical protein
VEGIFEKSGAIPSAADNAQRSQMYVSLIDTLAKLHAVDIDKAGLGAYGKRRDPAVDVRESGYIARQIKVDAAIGLCWLLSRSISTIHCSINSSIHPSIYLSIYLCIYIIC